jgi:hypothetical protein
MTDHHPTPIEGTTTMITIALSERAPVSISPEAWPIVAQAGAYHLGATRYVEVREHADGRRIVSCYTSIDDRRRPPRGGHVVQASSDEETREAETIRAIRRCAGIIERPDMGAACIEALPAREI